MYQLIYLNLGRELSSVGELSHLNRKEKPKKRKHDSFKEIISCSLQGYRNLSVFENHALLLFQKVN